MKLFFTLLVLICLSNPIRALPQGQDNNGAAATTIVGPGCTWCSSPLVWTTDQDCNTYEYTAVASSLRNPPANIAFNATAFCSEFLKPLLTQVSTVDVTSSITTTTIAIDYLTLLTPTSTAAAMSMDMGMSGMSTLASVKKTSTLPASPGVTPSSKSALAQLGKRDFTIPDFTTPWYYYGRIDPACSCIITSANSPLHFSAIETDIIYNTTISITTTVTYTIYPKDSNS